MLWKEEKPMEEELFQLKKRPPEVREQLANVLYPEGAITQKEKPMASVDAKLILEPSERFLAELQGAKEELRAAREALSEARIREIIRDELAGWEKRQVQRVRFGEQFERK